MRESTARKRLLELFKNAGIPAIPVENISWPGTPDISYPGGWIEVKTVENSQLPKKATSPLKIDHFSTHQRRFLMLWAQSEAKAFMVLVMGKMWLLLSGEYAWQYIGRHTPEQIRDNALLVSHHIFEPQALLDIIL